MKKTYITTMPNHIGAFLKASECFAKLGINITRVSYNKAIDSHTLFIEAEGESDKLILADEQLSAIGYLQSSKNENSIVLLEFTLCDVPGSVTQILQIIENHHLNISYISSQENGTEYQAFKMGLFVEDFSAFDVFLQEARKFCPVRILDYNHSEKVYDNSIFYQSFVSALVKSMELPAQQRESLLVNSNLVMQILDEKGVSPYKTFESISRFAEQLASCRKKAFSPRITRHKITEQTQIILIEPPCGSNTCILKSMDEYLFIDCGYALYREEMLSIFHNIIGNFDSIKKRIIITHADLDHCGLLSVFDEVLASSDTKKCLELEYNGKNGFREQNPLHKPYISICKALTFYQPPEPDKVKALWKSPEKQTEALEQTGFFDFGELHFEVYQGKGGHLKGETIFIDYINHLVFTGDVFVNVHEMTKEQALYNQYAPVLMTSVDTDSALCALERKAVFQRLGEGEWKIFGAHGMVKEYSIKHM
jgi:glyoxylase-like metal-dependent hydrolase (beta-lactamase superfamily II)